MSDDCKLDYLKSSTSRTRNGIEKCVVPKAFTEWRL